MFKFVGPDTFNDDNNVDAPETYKLVKLVLLIIANVELLDNEFKLLNMVFIVVCKLFKFVLVAYPDKSGLFVIAL